MSFKKEAYETWVRALERYDKANFTGALEDFELISEMSARIQFNVGIIHATIGEHQKATAAFTIALKRDEYLAIAHFQRGVSHFLIGNFEDALADFDSALRDLRDNTCINYEQLGLRFGLYSCEVMFNRALCHRYLDRQDAAMRDLALASKAKKVPDRHDVIDEAINDHGEGYTVFSVPVGTIFRPIDLKIRSADKRPHASLAGAKAVAAPDTRKAPVDAKPHQRSKSASALGIHIRRKSNDKNLPPVPKSSMSLRLKKRPAMLSTLTSSSKDKPLVPAPAPAPAPAMAPALAPAPSIPLPLPPKSLPVVRAKLSISGSSILSASSNSSNSSNRSSSSSSTSSGSSSSARTPGMPRIPAASNEDEDYDYVPDYYGSEYSGWSELSRPASGDTDFVVLSKAGGRRRRTYDMSKIKVKIHYNDLIVIYIDPAIDYSELTGRVRTKLKLPAKHAGKIKFQDEDRQQILLGDQEDLDHAIEMCGEAARRAGSDVGKMEIWVCES